MHVRTHSHLIWTSIGEGYHGKFRQPRYWAGNPGASNIHVFTIIIFGKQGWGYMNVVAFQNILTHRWIFFMRDETCAVLVIFQGIWVFFLISTRMALVPPGKRQVPRWKYINWTRNTFLLNTNPCQSMSSFPSWSHTQAARHRSVAFR